MSKSIEGENLVLEDLLNGKIYDTRNLWYYKIEENIEKDESEVEHLNQEIPSKNSFIKMKHLLDTGTELRNKYTNENLDKIPFECFVENKDDTYFVEVKTKTKPDGNYFSFGETQLFGMVAAKKCKIPVYIIWLYGYETDLKSYVPHFEMLEISNYRLPIPSKNIAINKRMLNTNPFSFDSCNEGTCKKVIRKEFVHLIKE
ncbi:hypothetical protein [Candidatus Methanoperedens nitratireducens]|uniref:Uncharacterized protein n=1 Tax=Candidatus Methanoperedens nitratireducens TaxID=1392998 RepID=A0A284VTW1_9EURY|nr:hypothetical protein [Candidatus Methanoperedens nitroreducens]SNQ62720.1 hypothetical protein MNV_820025 [Candidatus Methanoperedens nitroreducens]